jgi:hypothetical protein
LAAHAVTAAPKTWLLLHSSRDPLAFNLGISKRVLWMHGAASRAVAGHPWMDNIASAASRTEFSPSPKSGDCLERMSRLDKLVHNCGLRSEPLTAGVRTQGAVVASSDIANVIASIVDLHTLLPSTRQSPRKRRRISNDSNKILGIDMEYIPNAQRIRWVSTCTGELTQQN